MRLSQGKVRVVEVDPEKVRLVRRALVEEFVDTLRRHLSRRSAIQKIDAILEGLQPVLLINRPAIRPRCAIQMKLAAADAGKVSGIAAQQFRRGDDVGRKRRSKAGHPGRNRTSSREKRRAGRHALRRGTKEAVEPRAFACEPVEIRRPDGRVAIAASKLGRMVVGEDQNDVGLGLLLGGE